jgi:predicted DsbA family dithiol-disulfide isomerase
MLVMAADHARKARRLQEGAVLAGTGGRTHPPGDNGPRKPAMDTAPAPAGRLEIVSDVICPWCWIGRAHLDHALTILAAEGLTFDIGWLPYQLNPDMPVGGVERAAYRAQKFGSVERGAELDAQVAEAGRAAGLAFRHDLMMRTPNTVEPHRLIRLAGPTGLQHDLVGRLFRAYFQEGQDIGDVAVLTRLGAEVGLPAPVIDAFTAGEAAREEVVSESLGLAQAGIRGVPSFLLDRHLLFSGAMPGERMAEGFRQAVSILRSRAA